MKILKLSISENRSLWPVRTNPEVFPDETVADSNFLLFLIFYNFYQVKAVTHLSHSSSLFGRPLNYDFFENFGKFKHILIRVPLIIKVEKLFSAVRLTNPLKIFLLDTNELSENFGSKK